MPIAPNGSLGGAVSRSVLDRSLHAAYDRLPALPSNDFWMVQNFVTDKIFAEARTRTIPPKKVEEHRNHSRPSESNEQNSFVVPAPAAAAAGSTAGKKDLGAMIQRSTPPPPAAQPATTTNHEAESAADDANKRGGGGGKGFGTKNLAAMRARATTKD